MTPDKDKEATPPALLRAVKARCGDCCKTGCEFNECALKNLSASFGKAMNAVERYCKWCMNKKPLTLCASPECSIYRYRMKYGGGPQTGFPPRERDIIKAAYHAAKGD
jgi:hypothetical protein